MSHSDENKWYIHTMELVKNGAWDSLSLYEVDTSSVNDLLFKELAAVSPFTEKTRHAMERLFPKPNESVLFDTICFTRSNEALTYLLTKLPYPNLLNPRGANLINAYITYYATYDDCEDDEEWVFEKVRKMIAHGISPNLPNDRHEVAAQILEGMESGCYMCENWKLMRLFQLHSSE